MLLRVGSRGSRLALTQAERAAAALRRSGVEIALVPITTTGDRDRTAPFGEIGARVPITGQVVANTFRDRLPHFDELWNVQDLFQQSHVHYSVFGNRASPTGYHAVNLLLHAVNALLVFALVRGVRV